MKIIGITGGIGSGKTIITKLFGLWGVPAHNADAVAKHLMGSQPALIAAIQSVFGDDTYNDQGILQPSILANKVFGDAAALQRLNAIVHPAVARHFEQWCQQCATQNPPFVLKETAILYEQNLHHALDAVIVVHAPAALRTVRTVRRSHLTPAQVHARIAAQMPDDARLQLADYIIYNDDTQLVIPQAWAIYQALIAPK